MKNTARSQIEALLSYYSAFRAVGHTTTMLKGAENTDCVIITATEKQAKYMQERLPENRTVLSLTSLDTHLLGMTKPIALDNDAIIVMLSRLLEEIETRDKRLREAKTVLKALSETI